VRAVRPDAGAGDAIFVVVHHGGGEKMVIGS
jgi:hypothetical protein